MDTPFTDQMIVYPTDPGLFSRSREESQRLTDEFRKEPDFRNESLLYIYKTRKQQAQVDWIRAKLDKSERNGFTDSTKEQILNQSKSLLNG